MFSQEEINIISYTLSGFRGKVNEIKYVKGVLDKVLTKKSEVQLSPEDASLLLHLIQNTSSYTLDVASFIDVLCEKLVNIKHAPKVEETNDQTED